MFFKTLIKRKNRFYIYSVSQKISPPLIFSDIFSKTVGNF